MVDCCDCFFWIALRVSRLCLGSVGVLVLSMSDLDRTCTSSMYTTTYGQLMKEFNCSQEVATLGLSFFIWGLGQS